MTNKKTNEDISQHKKDANKVLKDLDTMKCNVSGYGAESKWGEFVKARQKHINAFLKSLDAQEKELVYIK